MFVLNRGSWAKHAGLDFFDLDILTIFIAYLFLFYGEIGAGIFAFSQGLFIDLLSGGFHGLFAFLYLGVFGAVWVGCRIFNLQGPKGQVLLITVAVLFKKILLFVLFWIFSWEAFLPRSYLWISGASVAATGLMAPIFFRLFHGLKAVSIKRDQERSADQL